MKRLVIGIDPGTGRSSPTGFAAFDPDSRELVYETTFTSTHDDNKRRIKDIADQVEECLIALDPDLEVTVVTETFVMQGKTGMLLQRLIGAIHASVPYRHALLEVFNTSVKRIVGGSGKADKAALAASVQQWMSSEDPTHARIKAHIRAQNWDITDAIAIGIAGYTATTANN